MMRVIVESPFAGDFERNARYAKVALLDSITRGEAPLASHLLYTQVLNDENPIERKIGINLGLAWFEMADQIVFYEDLGWSPGMKDANRLAEQLGISITCRKIGPNWDSQP